MKPVGDGITTCLNLITISLHFGRIQPLYCATKNDSGYGGGRLDQPSRTPRCQREPFPVHNLACFKSTVAVQEQDASEMIKGREITWRQSVESIQVKQ